jgi:hypothetical protein
LRVVLSGGSLPRPDNGPFESPTSTPRVSSVTPLAVAGTVHGRAVEALVTGLSDVLAQIAAWTADDPEAIGCWGLRADYSEPLIVPIRQRDRGHGQTGRSVHLLRLRPGEAHGRTLVAMCGELLSLVSVTTTEVGSGMPCEPCLTRHPALDAGRDGCIPKALDHRGLR